MDPQQPWPKSARWPYGAVSHLMVRPEMPFPCGDRLAADRVVADLLALEELHAFAARLGLRRRWFQNKRLPHYDLAPSKRRLAVSLGAIELDRNAAVEVYRAWR